MGWGEAHVLKRDRAGMHLAEAVRAFRDHGSTANQHRLFEALDRYDVAVADPPLEETGRPAGW